MKYEVKAELLYAIIKKQDYYIKYLLAERCPEYKTALQLRFESNITDLNAQLEQSTSKSTIERKDFFESQMKKEPGLTDSEIEEMARKYAKEHSSAPDADCPEWIIADYRAGAYDARHILTGVIQDKGQPDRETLRKELIKYEKFCGTYFDDSDQLIDNYLIQKNKT